MAARLNRAWRRAAAEPVRGGPSLWCMRYRV